jgi:hypothetical protein
MAVGEMRETGRCRKNATTATGYLLLLREELHVEGLLRMVYEDGVLGLTARAVSVAKRKAKAAKRLPMSIGA